MFSWTLSPHANNSNYKFMILVVDQEHTHTSIFFCGPANCTYYPMELLYRIFYWFFCIFLNVMLWGKYLCTETSGAVRKTGGNFKEKLREHGGLDAVFDVTMNCHSDLKVWACMLVQVQYIIYDLLCLQTAVDMNWYSL